MPEGDTVWNTAYRLRDLVGATVEHSDFRLPALATVDLTGWRVGESLARGKHLLLRLVDPAVGTALTLHTHLRMDGSWRVFRPGEAWRGGPTQLIRVVVRTAAAVAVGYHLHDVALLPTARESDVVGHLGPDLLGAPGEPGGWSQDEAVRRLRSHPERTIAEALLDQTNLAGIGNLYKSEVLFLRGIHPRTPIASIADLDSLTALARSLLRANCGRWTQATTGSLRRGEQTYVYGRAGAACRRCTTIILRETQGERSTYWCPGCQAAAPISRTAGVVAE